MLSKAIEIAIKAHSGQPDRDGQPYVLHPLRVMLNCETETEKICAALHDVVEDTALTMEDLCAQDFSQEVLDAVDSLSRRDGETYQEYIDRLVKNPTACRVKLADLADNMNLNLAPGTVSENIERIKKYVPAAIKVSDALGDSTEFGKLSGDNGISAIFRRYTCRDYQDTPVPKSVLRTIAHAAVASPSGMNRQPWQIIVVDDLALIGEIEAEGLKNLANLPDKTSYERIMSRGGRLFYGAPSMIVIAVDKSFGGYAMMDCGIAAENVALAASGLHMGSCICGFAALCFSGEKGAEFAQRLKIPEGYEFGISVLLGYEKNPGKPHEPDYGKIIYV